jgi:hypothetical protein
VLIAQNTDYSHSVWRWSGTAWSPVTVTNDLAAHIGTGALAAYDRARHVVLLVGYDQSALGWALWSFDLATGTWSPLPAPPSANAPGGFAYDATRQVAILTYAFTATRIWDGTSWQTYSTFPSNQVLTYDPRAGGVVAQSVDVAQLWDGAAWTSLPETGSVVGSELWYDDDRQRRVIFAGDVYEYDGSQWSSPIRSWPTDYWWGWLTYDVKRKELVELLNTAQMPGHTVNELWTYRDGWNNVPVVLGNVIVGGIAYDPVRDTIVGATQLGTTFFIHDHVLTSPAIAGPIGSNNPMAYDASRGAVVSAGSGTLELPSNADLWTQIDPAQITQNGDLVFDARSNQLVLGNGAGTVQLEPEGWSPSLSASLGVLAEDQRRGTIEQLGSGMAYERISGAWHERLGLPAKLTSNLGLHAAYAPESGTLYVIGDVGTSSHVMMTRQFVGPSPLDGCTGGDDDGDGLVDCADPECWWACQPGCPPYATCP